MPSTSLVFEGGTIRTLDPAAPVIERLAITDGLIAKAPAADARRVDLRGGCVLPGFNDAHVHFPTWSLAQRQVRLEGAHSLSEAVARVADGMAGAPPGAWVRGIGWRDSDWTEPPSRTALDAVAPDTPVILTSKDYHSLWLNSAALARAGGDLDAPGGVVKRDPGGEATGVLRENAAWRFRDRHAAPTMEEMLEASREGLRIAASRGVTAVHDKDGWLGSLELFQRLRESGELTLRVWQSIPAERLPQLRALGLRSGFGDDLLRAGYLKVFMDGTLGSATARLLDGSGVELTSGERLAEIVREAAAAGWPVGVHAIGDAANRAALDAFEATAGDWRPLGLRQRIEHAQLLDPAELPRFAAIGVAASVQFSHAPSDRDLADRVWEGHPGAYAYRSLHDAGARLANGSDAPVEELDPLRGVAAAVLRSLDERPAWRPEQALSVEAALRATCVEPVWLAHDELRRGRLAPELLADLVVLDRDPITCPEDELPQLRVAATLVGGRITYATHESGLAFLGGCELL
ncbi:MAG: amidohydrolase [Thermoleophilaceae bacterium]|nr:amidohydrolase [Thermoleophilaceae bacterium]